MCTLFVPGIAALLRCGTIQARAGFRFASRSCFKYVARCRAPPQVALARSPLPYALMDARTQGRAIRGLATLAQLLQDLSEEVVVVWG